MIVVRTPSMSTFDSLELGRCSDDGRDIEERVAGIYYNAQMIYQYINLYVCMYTIYMYII